jgi:hypothetical protein
VVSLLPITASAGSGTMGAGDAVVAIGDEGAGDSTAAAEGAGGRVGGDVSLAFSTATKTGETGAGAGAGVGAA